MLSPMEELRFWTGIMRDHGEFILSSLSYNEQEALKHAAFYKETVWYLNRALTEYREIKRPWMLQAPWLAAWAVPDILP